MDQNTGENGMKELILTGLGFIGFLVCVYMLAGGLHKKRREECMKAGGIWVQAQRYENSVCIYDAEKLRRMIK